MTTIRVNITPPPKTPLNLQSGVTYAPRVPTPPFVGYVATQVSRDEYDIFGYCEDGSGATLFSGGLMETFQRLALHLSMDVAPDATE